MSVDDSLVNYAYDFIKDIIEQFGPRFSSSDAERKANEWIQGELNGICDETNFEEFETRPKLYPQGVFKVVGVLGLIAPAFMVFRVLSILPAVLIGAGIFVLWAELFHLKRWISPLFKKGTSTNTWGRIKPTGEVKWRVVFEGHTDSARQMRIVEKEKIPFGKFAIGIFHLVLTMVFSISKFVGIMIPSIAAPTVYANTFLTFTMIDVIYFVTLPVFYSFFVYLIYMLHGEVIVPGAGDNLSASAVAAAVGKYLSKNRPRNVEVIIGSMGSEEIGDQGAKAFVAAHGDLLKNAYAFIMDDIACGCNAFNLVVDDFHVKNGYSPEVIERIEKAHELYAKDNPDAAHISRRKLGIGSSDACMYVNAGYKAAWIVGILIEEGVKGIKRPPNWHSTRDTWENIKKNMLKDAIGIALKFVEIVDSEFDA
ncbi:MAG: M28 family peptidase [Promethearchaeota archaeon]